MTQVLNALDHFNLVKQTSIGNDSEIGILNKVLSLHLYIFTMQNIYFIKNFIKLILD